MYGSNGPEAESLIPFMKFIKQADNSLNLFMYGSQTLCNASTPSSGECASTGLEGRLISRSGVAGPDW